jgi:N-acetylmuramoyl-L-alanine amidase
LQPGFIKVSLNIEVVEMVQIFVSAGHGGFESGGFDPGSSVGGTTEAREMELTRDLIMSELNSLQAKALSVPDKLSLKQSIAWINARAGLGDVAIEIHADEATPRARGASIFFVAENDERRADGKIVLDTLLAGVAGIMRHGGGVKPDTDSAPGSLGFCRQVSIPSLLIELGFLSNPQDLSLIQNKRKDFAKSIANGLVKWSKLEASRKGLPVSTPVPSIPTSNIVVQGMIDIILLGQIHSEQGILVNGNSYVPIDLVDSLGIDVSRDPAVRRIQHQNIIYARAVDLEKFNISIKWDSQSRSLRLDPIPKTSLGKIDQIMGIGHASVENLRMFLETNNSDGLSLFPNLPKLYYEESAIEKVNHDIAFCQMCLETGFLAFGGDVDPAQNNFCGLGTTGGGVAGAVFPDARTGVRAHIQHLKAYASKEPLVLMPSVDPRFGLIARGVAPTVNELSGRWATSPEYGDSILALLRKLYKMAGLL